MKSTIFFPLLGLLACGALTAACSSTGDGNGNADSNASDLGTGGDADPCANVRILCPTASHCEGVKGLPACVPDAPVKNGFSTQGDASAPPHPVGFFPNDDAGSEADGGGDSGTCPPGKQRCCTSTGFQCIYGGALCVMSDAACESTPPKVGFFGK